MTIYIDGSNIGYIGTIPLVTGHAYTRGDVEGIGGRPCEPENLINSMQEHFDLETLNGNTEGIWSQIELPGTYQVGTSTRYCRPPAPELDLAGRVSDAPVVRALARSETREPQFHCVCEDWWAAQGLEAPEPEQLPDTYELAVSYVTSDQLASAE